MISGPIRFIFKHLGPISKAELELGDLTVISGRNNTGKTYMAYALYGFMRKFFDVSMGHPVSGLFDAIFLDKVSKNTEEIETLLNENGVVEWNTDSDELAGQQIQLIQKVSQEFSQNELFGVFAAPEGLFEDSTFEAKFGVEIQSEVYASIEVVENRELHLRYDGKTVGFELLDSGLDSEDNGEADPDEMYISLDGEIRRLYSYLLLQGIFEAQFIPTIFSSARHSIPMFVDELDYARSQWIQMRIRERRRARNAENPRGRELTRGFASYALPIHDNINLFRGISARAERSDNRPQGQFSSELENMMRGRYSSSDGELRFTASEENELSFDIPLFLASSSAWEMSSLYFYLKYHMRNVRNHFLVIDEPESHLDTANQVRLTRLLARLVNSGAKVLITTHSDYIVRELNNLIMLSSPLEGGDEIKRELEYEEGDELSIDQVQAYVAKCGELEECDKNEFGIAMPVFDETIDDLNERSEKLASRILMKESGE